VSLIRFPIILIGEDYWIQDYEVVFTGLALLRQKTWNDDKIKKRRFVQNAQNIGLVDTVFEESVSDKSFIETRNFLRSHAIRLDQQYKEKAARQIHNTSQSSNRAKKDKIKKVLAIVNEIKIQYSCSSDEHSITVPPNKTAMVCKLAQIPPEIWMNLSLEAKKWLLNERKLQKQDYDYKMMNSLALSKSTALPNDKETSNYNMLNQFVRVKNVEKGEDVIKENTDHTYDFIDESTEEAIKNSIIYETNDDVDCEY
jgi:hypothetical protein